MGVFLGASIAKQPIKRQESRLKPAFMQSQSPVAILESSSPVRCLLTETTESGCFPLQLFPSDASLHSVGV